MARHNRRSGFTIVELLIVIVVIGILAGLVIVAYNGIKSRADEASLQGEITQLNQKILTYKVTNGDALPADATIGGLSVASNHTLYYRVTPDGKNYCLASSMQGDPTVAYSVVSTQSAVKKGTCEGYILVPGNAILGTSDFWVMKYEAKNVNGKALSQAASTPWVNISQTDAISTSQSACEGCHLITEAEWMTIAANILGIWSNWSYGTVGSGYVYSGHNDSVPNNTLAADTNDNNAYAGTGNSYGETATTNGMQGNSQKRTLGLTNGEGIWDFSGNAWELTNGVISAGGSPGVSGGGWASREWTNGSMAWNSLALLSRPAMLSSVVGLASVTSWSSAQGIGHLYSNYGDAQARAFARGGHLSSTNGAGVLALGLPSTPSDINSIIGFRVAR